MTSQISPEKRRLCADSALECYGTAYIFERRAAKIRTKIKVLTFLGIAGPASVGAIIGTYNIDTNQLKILLLISGIIAIPQFVCSIWSVVSGWDRNLSYSLESKAANYRLASQFDRLGKTGSMSPNEFDIEFQLIGREEEFRKNQDNQHDISESEKRMGMRYGLRQYQRNCAGCKRIPNSMKSTNCGICGKF